MGPGSSKHRIEYNFISTEKPRPRTFFPTKPKPNNYIIGRWKGDPVGVKTMLDKSSDNIKKYCEVNNSEDSIIPGRSKQYTPYKVKTDIDIDPTKHRDGYGVVFIRLALDHDFKKPLLTEHTNAENFDRWLNGEFDFTIDDEFDSRGDLFAEYTTPTDFYKVNNTLKAMRCCLGADPLSLNRILTRSKFGINGYSIINVPEQGKSLGTTQFISESSDGKYEYIYNYNFIGHELWDYRNCPYDTRCPGSKMCKDLYKNVINGKYPYLNFNIDDFGDSYPELNILDRDTSGHLSYEILTNPSYYVKAYCELMSGGGSDITNSKRFMDDEVNTMCRKLMYKYCSEPIEVDVIKDSDYWKSNGSPSPDNLRYSKSSYKLPLKIFTEGCNMWLKGELKDVMPSDYGTRDMLLESTCQQLQADGWLDPLAPGSSPLLKAFVSKDGKIKNKVTGKEYDVAFMSEHAHTLENEKGSIPALLAETCGCFLIGSGCDNNNCSMHRCGLGTNINDVLGAPVDQSVKLNMSSAIASSVNLEPYTNRMDPITGRPLGDSSWTKYKYVTSGRWSSNIDTDSFTCTSGNVSEGINYGTESGGTSSCFNGCNYHNEYDSCWNSYSNKTDFDSECTGDNYEMGINPAEIKYRGTRATGKASIMNTPYWQNFYSGIGNVAHIGGIGTIENTGRSFLQTLNYCADGGIKPYNTRFSDEVSCTIKQNTNVNNQGIISGSVNISNIFDCNIQYSNNYVMNDTDKKKYLMYMGRDVCRDDDQGCWNRNEVCIVSNEGSSTISNNGDNCMICGESDIGISSPRKTATCCLDPSLSNNATYRSKNKELNKLVSLNGKNVISYLCGKDGECPPGSANINILQGWCGSDFKCSDQTNQTSCEECRFCKWSPELRKESDGSIKETGNFKCIPTCPIAPSSGWNYDSDIGPGPGSLPDPSDGSSSDEETGSTDSSDNLLFLLLLLIIPVIIAIAVFVIKKRNKG